ncbi:hypothetical protein [Variovorax rhizosphaerae]|uniref:Uncharacterized protein n=1 Tax=Variovorax rhizosphaerae TaxID=1836200 RepID=A0ABU8WQ00_9BURK
MRPKVEIEKIRESYFNYSVSTESGNAIYACEGLYSIAECIHDAATALGHNFPITTLGYEGFVLGEFSVEMMEHSAKLLERWLEALLNGLAPNGRDGDDCRWQPLK